MRNPKPIRMCPNCRVEELPRNGRFICDDCYALLPDALKQYKARIKPNWTALVRSHLKIPDDCRPHTRSKRRKRKNYF